VSKQRHLSGKAMRHVREAIAKPNNTTSHRLAMSPCWSAQHLQPENRLMIQLQNVLDLELTQVGATW
jgi:hypothetical protein